LDKFVDEIDPKEEMQENTTLDNDAQKFFCQAILIPLHFLSSFSWSGKR